MKKILLGVFIGLSLTLTVAFKVAYNEVKKNKAEVNQIEGVFIFVDSKPVADYEYLGTVKGSALGSLGSSQYQPIRDRLLKKLKIDYPQADGAIFSLNNDSRDHVDAIKFKE